jgi:hypothetical protein
LLVNSRFSIRVVAACCLLLAGAVAQQPAAARAEDKPQAVRITRQPSIEFADQHNAVIAWSSDQPSGTQVKYGTTPDQLSERAEMPWGSLTHRVELKNLQPGTQYYFVAIASEARDTGTSAQSELLSFRTPADGAPPLRDQPAQRTGPERAAGAVAIVSGPTVEALADSAVVSWSSSANSGAVVHYGSDAGKLDHAASVPWGGREHRVRITELKPGTTYYFVAESTEAEGSGTRAQSAVGKFTTRSR